MNPDYKRINIEALTLSNKFMLDYHTELKEADHEGGQKIAWCTSMGPAELLRSMGYLVFFPENHAATIGAMRMAPDLIDTTTAAYGWTPNVCSYATSDIGSYMTGKTPLAKFGLKRVPRPDVLVYHTSQCRDVQDWFEWYGREFDVPVLGIHGPRGVDPSQKKLMIELGVNQLKQLSGELEEAGGDKFDLDRFKEVARLSRDCSVDWKACLDLTAASPAPWTFWDQCIHMGAAVVLRGTPEAAEYYKTLRQEIQGFVDRKEPAVPGEKVRLLWVGINIWGVLSSMSKKLGILQAPIVGSTYCSSWVYDWEPENPFESHANIYCAKQFVTQNDQGRQKHVENLCDQFHVDGILYHDCWTCSFTTDNRYGQAERIQKNKGIKSLVINGDVADDRLFSKEQTNTQLEAFIEELEEDK